MSAAGVVSLVRAVTCFSLVADDSLQIMAQLGMFVPASSARLVVFMPACALVYADRFVMY